MSTVVLLGPQQPMPSLAPALQALGLRGPFCVVTAGWQEREGETAALEQHLGAEVVDLGLYRRTEDVFRREPRFAAAYRARQTRLKELQRLYRVRLGHALAAVRELMGADADRHALAHARAGALAAVRTLDRQHLREVRKVHAAFETDWRPGEREALAEHRAAVAALIREAAALLIAGGHVAVLVNRLRLLAIDEAVRDRCVVAWSAGAMALAERIVLFHDHPPQGPNDPEVLEHGLGLVEGVVPLPHARRRLATDDAARVRLFAARFAPARCLAFDQGALLEVTDGAWRRTEELRALGKGGGLAQVAAS
jgi:peptidase E